MFVFKHCCYQGYTSLSFYATILHQPIIYLQVCLLKLIVIPDIQPLINRTMLDRIQLLRPRVMPSTAYQLPARPLQHLIAFTIPLQSPDHNIFPEEIVSPARQEVVCDPSHHGRPTCKDFPNPRLYNPPRPWNHYHSNYRWKYPAWSGGKFSESRTVCSRYTVRPWVSS